MFKLDNICGSFFAKTEESRVPDSATQDPDVLRQVQDKILKDFEESQTLEAKAKKTADEWRKKLDTKEEEKSKERVCSDITLSAPQPPCTGFTAITMYQTRRAFGESPATGQNRLFARSETPLILKWDRSALASTFPFFSNSSFTTLSSNGEALGVDLANSCSAGANVFVNVIMQLARSIVAETLALFTFTISLVRLDGTFSPALSNRVLLSSRVTFLFPSVEGLVSPGALRRNPSLAGSLTVSPNFSFSLPPVGSAALLALLGHFAFNVQISLAALKIGGQIATISSSPSAIARCSGGNCNNVDLDCVFFDVLPTSKLQMHLVSGNTPRAVGSLSVLNTITNVAANGAFPGAGIVNPASSFPPNNGLNQAIGDRNFLGGIAGNVIGDTELSDNLGTNNVSV